jgi:hypothetical protein
MHRDTVAQDESGPEIVRNLTSVGVRLAPHLASGLLTMYSGRTEALSLEEHVLEVKSLVRELILSDGGITLADVYSAGGEVLVGTLRWEREKAEENELKRLEREMERKRREFELAQAETSGRMEALQREMEARRMDLTRLNEEQSEVERRRTATGKDLPRRRDADKESKR